MQSYKDFEGATLWVGSVYTFANNVTVKQLIPVWCCRMKSTANFPVPSFSDQSCLTAPSSSNSFVATPCAAALIAVVKEETFTWLDLVFWSAAALVGGLLLAVGITALANDKTDPLLIPENPSNWVSRKTASGPPAPRGWAPGYSARPSPRLSHVCPSCGLDQVHTHPQQSYYTTTPRSPRVPVNRSESLWAEPRLQRSWE